MEAGLSGHTGPVAQTLAVTGKMSELEPAHLHLLLMGAKVALAVVSNTRPVNTETLAHVSADIASCLLLISL